MTSIKRSILVLLSFLMTFIGANAQSTKVSQDRTVLDRVVLRRTIEHIHKDEARKNVTTKELTNDYRPILASARGICKEFLARAIPLAISIQAKFGIPASSILAMACFESNYGQSQLSEDAHNYFGIKALRNWDGSVTWAYTRDSGHRHKQPFREYDSMAESFMDYARFLKGQPRYATAFRTSNGEEFVRRVLRSGYCPDSDYLDYISDIMDRYHLRSLDRG